MIMINDLLFIDVFKPSWYWAVVAHESPKLITYPLESNITRKYQPFSDVQSQKIRETAPVIHFQHAPVDNSGCIHLLKSNIQHVQHPIGWLHGVTLPFIYIGNYHNPRIGNFLLNQPVFHEENCALRTKILHVHNSRSNSWNRRVSKTP